MRSIANQHQSITRPIFDQGDFAFKWEEWLKVVERIGETRKDWVQTPYALGHCSDTGFPPLTPRARRQKQAGLDLVGIFGEQQALYVRPQRKIHRIGPVWRLLYDK